MPLPGGAAEKFGNRYEGRWTVARLLDVMDEKADSIRLEPPGPEEQGFGCSTPLRLGSTKYLGAQSGMQPEEGKETTQSVDG